MFSVSRIKLYTNRRFNLFFPFLSYNDKKIVLNRMTNSQSQAYVFNVKLPSYLLFIKKFKCVDYLWLTIYLQSAHFIVGNLVAAFFQWPNFFTI